MKTYPKKNSSSYKPKSETKKYNHFIVTDLDQLVADHSVDGEINTESADKIKCMCPYCVPLGGEPAPKMTLTVFTETLSFWCYRCKTMGISDKISMSSEAYKEYRVQREVNRNVSEDLPEQVFESIDIGHLKPITDDEYLTYFIEKRSYKYIPFMDIWDFREIVFSGRKGFIIPFYYDGKIITYQIRYLKVNEKRNEIKYYTDVGTKIPYFIDGFYSNKRYDTITLVEGIFDAAAAKLFNLPNPIGLLGSAIPDNIYDIIIKILKPTTIIFAFDDMKINLELSKRFNNYFCQLKFINTKGSDLDEYLKAGKTPKVIDHEKYLDDLRADRIHKRLGKCLNLSM